MGGAIIEGRDCVGSVGIIGTFGCVLMGCMKEAFGFANADGCSERRATEAKKIDMRLASAYERMAHTRANIQKGKMV